METELLPMSLGDIFDEGFDLYKKNFTLFAGIVAAVHVPAQLIWYTLFYGFGWAYAVSSGPTMSEREMDAFVGFFFLNILVYTPFFVIQCGALTIAISERHLGKSITLGDAYRRTLSRFWGLMGTWLVVFLVLAAISACSLMAMGLIVGILYAGTGGGPSDQASTTVIGAVAVCLMLVSGVAAMAKTGLFAIQISTLERLSNIKAVYRNIRLSRIKQGRIFGMAILLPIVTVFFFACMTQSFKYIADLTLFAVIPTSSMVQSVVASTWAMVVMMFLMPYVMTCLTLMYYDQRVRGEGFDLSLLELQVNQSSGRRIGQT